MTDIEPVSTHLVDEEQQALIASACAGCGHVAFPVRFFCPNCAQPGPFVETLLRQGNLSGFTVCHVAPAGFEAPYLAGWVTFPQGPSVFAVVRSPEGQTPHDGDAVCVKVVRRETSPGWEFELVSAREGEP